MSIRENLMAIKELKKTGPQVGHTVGDSTISKIDENGIHLETGLVITRDKLRATTDQNEKVIWSLIDETRDSMTQLEFDAANPFLIG